MPKTLDHTAALTHLSRVDRGLAKIIARHGDCGLRQETTQSIFAALLDAIIYQQLNGKVAATITARVKALFPDNTAKIRTRRGLVAGFPAPEQILAASDELLRSAGLSRNKMLAIRDLAAKTLDGTVPTVRQAQRMGDDELVERLTTVRGIGRWTVEMLLIFRLGRPDVFPVDDYGVRKGFAKVRQLADLPKPKELMPLGERWRPYRSVASWYLWRAAEMKDLPIAAEKIRAAASSKRPAKKSASQKAAKRITRAEERGARKAQASRKKA